MRLGLIVIGLAVAVLVPFAIWGEPMDAWLDGDAALESLKHFEPWTAIAAVALLIADIVMPLPASGVMAALGVLYGPWIGGLLSAIGNFLSGLVAFALCRRFGQPAARWFLGEKLFARDQAHFSRFGAVGVAGSRALPVLPEVTACLAGLLDMEWRRFVIALAVGAGVTGFGFALLGYLGRGEPAIVVIIAILLPPMLLLFAGHRINTR